MEAKGGLEATNLKVAEQYIEAFGKLAKETNTLLLPSQAGDVASMIATAMSVVKKTQKEQ